MSDVRLLPVRKINPESMRAPSPFRHNPCSPSNFRPSYRAPPSHISTSVNQAQGVFSVFSVFAVFALRLTWTAQKPNHHESRRRRGWREDEGCASTSWSNTVTAIGDFNESAMARHAKKALPSASHVDGGPNAQRGSQTPNYRKCTFAPFVLKQDQSW